MPSAVIAGFEYDDATCTLIVRYVSGKTYHYKNVPAQIYNQMRSAFAKGIFLNRQIKGKYPFEEIKEQTGL
jgi:hypothetical protein